MNIRKRFEDLLTDLRSNPKVDVEVANLGAPTDPSLIEKVRGDLGSSVLRSTFELPLLRGQMTITARSCLFIFTSWLSLMGCSSSGGGTSSVRDSGARRDATAANDGAKANDAATANDATLNDGAISDGGSCGAIANLGTVVSGTGDMQDPAPQATGGTIADGTYALTALTEYEFDSSGANRYIICGGELSDIQETDQLANGKIREIVAANGDSPTGYAGTFSAAGSTLTIHFTCPYAYVQSGGFSVIGNKILFIGPAGPTDSNGTCGPLVRELTRR